MCVKPEQERTDARCNSYVESYDRHEGVSVAGKVKAELTPTGTYTGVDRKLEETLLKRHRQRSAFTLEEQIFGMPVKATKFDEN
jgi:hypothetical protein